MNEPHYAVTKSISLLTFSILLQTALRLGCALTEFQPFSVSFPVSAFRTRTRMRE
jgi:hypothetical protein